MGQVQWLFCQKWILGCWVCFQKHDGSSWVHENDFWFWKNGHLSSGLLWTVSITYHPFPELLGHLFDFELIDLRVQYYFFVFLVWFHFLSYFWGLEIFRRLRIRRFSPEEQEGRVGLSEDLLGISGDSWVFADEGGVHHFNLNFSWNLPIMR